MCAHNIIIQKQFPDIPLDHFFQQNHGLSLRRRNKNDSGEHAGHLYGRKFQIVLTVLFSDQRADIQRLIADERERSGRVHRHRRQHRINVVLKIRIHISRLFSCQRFMSPDHPQSVFKQLRKKRMICIILPLHKRMRLLVHRGKLFFRRQARDILFRIPGIAHIF